ncbi:secernin-1 [Trichonephila clavipes]|nr:secernin-1 [Trichonephila clavipes]
MEKKPKERMRIDSLAEIVEVEIEVVRGVSPSLNRTVTCMVLKANDRRTSCPCHDEFRGPRSDYVRQVASATTTTTKKDLPITPLNSIQRHLGVDFDKTHFVADLYSMKENPHTKFQECTSNSLKMEIMMHNAPWRTNFVKIIL